MIKLALRHLKVPTRRKQFVQCERVYLVSKRAFSQTIVVKENFKNDKATTVMVQTITIINIVGFVQSVAITKYYLMICIAPINITHYYNLMPAYA